MARQERGGWAGQRGSGGAMLGVGAGGERGGRLGKSREEGPWVGWSGGGVTNSKFFMARCPS